MTGFSTDKFLFVHFPKTGGQWFYITAKSLGAKIDQITSDDDNHRVIESNLPRVAFIRNPLDWYISLFRYHVMTDWHFFKDLRGSDFFEFFDVQIRNECMSAMWHRIAYPVDVIGRFSHLYTDTASILNLFGLNVTQEEVSRVPADNVSTTQFPVTPSDYRQRVMKADAEIFSMLERPPTFLTS